LPNAGANATKIFCQDPAPHGGLRNREFEL